MGISTVVFDIYTQTYTMTNSTPFLLVWFSGSRQQQQYNMVSVLVSMVTMVKANAA